MNRKLIVTLLQKDIQELNMITEGFMEMNEYPKAIISLALRKTEDIQSYFQQLANLKAELAISENSTSNFQEAPNTGFNNASPEIVPNPEVTDETKFVDEIQISPEYSEESSSVEETITVEVSQEIEKVVLEKESPTQIIEEITRVTIEEESTKTVLVEKTTTSNLSRNDLLSKEDHSISAIMANKKINDIKQAISIGDRFRFQRELYKGNGEDMNKTLNYINQLATFEEVQSFLQSKYNWPTDNETVEDFYQIVKRRFI